MGKKGVGPRGRTWVALFLLGFVLIAASVIQRRVFGIRQAREITALQLRLQELESEKQDLETDIAEARNLGRLGPIVEKRLGMHAPHDSLVVLIRPKSK